MAASVTVLAIGPAVSCVNEIGIIPDLLTRPTVGLIPTIPLAVAGQTTEPLVSVPMAITVRLAEAATPEPELDPQGFLSNIYGFLVCPLIPLQPLEDISPRKFAHSLKLAFARITAPASRNCLTTKLSSNGLDPSKALEPAVVNILSWVSILSLIITGIPCMAPLDLPSFNSLSSCSAILSASGFT